jgi:hypothetical protein
MVSGFSAAELADQHARFRTNRGEPLTEDDALEVLLRYAPDLQDEGPRIPEVVLVAESFPPVVLTTVVFLHEQLELPMRLVTIGAYRFADGELVVRATQLYPIDEVDTLKPRREERRQFQNARRGVRVVDQLLRFGEPPPGTESRFAPARMPLETREAVEAWLADDPSRGQAEWHPERDEARPLTWRIDGQQYSPTGLAKHIVRQTKHEARDFQARSSGCCQTIGGYLSWPRSSNQASEPPARNRPNEPTSRARPA